MEKASLRYVMNEEAPVKEAGENCYNEVHYFDPNVARPFISASKLPRLLSILFLSVCHNSNARPSYSFTIS